MPPTRITAWASSTTSRKWTAGLSIKNLRKGSPQLADPPLLPPSPLAELARPDSALVMAGLLTRQIADVRGAYEPAFVFDAPVIEDDWARLSARKTAS